MGGGSRRTQTAANRPEEPGEELRSPSMSLKAETLPLLLQGMVSFLIVSAASAFRANLSLPAATVIILVTWRQN